MVKLTCPKLLKSIIEELFPKDQHVRKKAYTRCNRSEVDYVTEEELMSIARNIGNKKAPGPDSIPNLALKKAILFNSAAFTNLYNSCLEESVFPSPWKIQRLVLLPKPNKQPGTSSSYRPICLLDTAGKILEKIVCNRLEPLIEANNGISARQYGFRKGRSTTDAIAEVVKIAKNAIESKGSDNKRCAVITLDIKNAFNSAKWIHILKALHKIKVPDYLNRLVADYFSKRYLIYDTDDGLKKYSITSGVPQGSVLGPLLWNLMYNDILELSIPEEAQIIGFADDIALVVTARSKCDLELCANISVMKIRKWLNDKGLSLAEHKTEVVLITNKKKDEVLNITVGNVIVSSKKAIRYLGVMIDTRLSFSVHVDLVCERSLKILAALSKLMTNFGGPSHKKRILLASVIRSIIVYASPAWAANLSKTNFKKLKKVNRISALRVCCAYRTTSYAAVCVIAGMIPIDILLKEIEKVYKMKHQGPISDQVRDEARANSIQMWQRKWDSDQYGRWTFKLISSISKWLERKHGEVNYYLTQFLGAHGCYRNYLCRIGIEVSSVCLFCGDAD